MNTRTAKQSFRRTRIGALAAIIVAAAALLGSACAPASDEELRIGLLMDQSGSLADFTPPLVNGARLAVEHINSAGGVYGKDVVLVMADTEGSPETAVSEARRLISEENVNAIVGAAASHVSLAVAEQVSAQERIPQVSPASSSTALTDADDGDFLFRTTVTDARQGAVLAEEVLEAIGGEESVGVIYNNNAYGQSTSSILRQNFGGSAAFASYEAGEDDFGDALSMAGGNGADALVIIGYAETVDILRASEADDLFSTYYFVSANRSQALAQQLDHSVTEGSYGTAPGSSPDPSAVMFRAAFEERFGEQPQGPFEAQGYDAVVSLALAAALANSTDGTAIRDNLRSAVSAPGTAVLASVESLRQGLSVASEGESLNYEGAASVIDWDSNGDISGGFVEIWRYEGGVPVPVRTVEAGSGSP